MADYTNNSVKAKTINTEKKEEPKKVAKIVKGKTGTKKKSELSKIASSMISHEITSIKEYAIYEVVIPVVKDTITQLIEGSINMLFYGDPKTHRRNGSRSNTNASRVSYRDFYDNKSDRRRDDSRATTRYSYDDISFERKEDAVEVLERMDEIVEQYGVVRVADLFEMAGQTGNGHTDQNYGWTSTKTASVERDRYGEYFIKIGRPAPIR